MNLKKTLVSITITVFAVFAAQFTAFAANSSDNTVGDAESVIGGILAYELDKNGYTTAQEWIDGSITENAGKSSEWYAIILSKSGNYDLTKYRSALEKYVNESNIASATSRMKNALALLSVGADKKLVNDIAESSVGEQGIMSLIYGLHLLNNKCECSRYTAGTLTDELLGMQFADGGWAIMGENGDIDVTAMTVQALAPQYEKNDKVTSAIDRALSFMSEKQLDNGGYKSFGTENPESTAQVLIALSQLGLDIHDTRFVKNGNTVIDGIKGFVLPDGSFSHIVGGDTNETATTQAYLSLTAYVISEKSGNKLYLFDENKTENAETVPESSPVETTSAVSTAVPAETTVPGTSVSPSPEMTGKTENTPGYKPIAYIIIGSLAVIGCTILFVLKKRRASNFITVIIIAGAAAAFVFFTDFRSSEEYYSGNDTVKDNIVGTVTIEIRCDTVAGKGSSEYIPADGTILGKTEFDISEGETVYDILTQAARKYNIQLQGDANGYIAGIGYLYEFDFGDLSGWIYHVNGDTPFMMCSEYKLSDGDTIEWLYTCDLGNDL